MPEILHIFLAPAKAARTQSVESVEAVAGRGLRGDRYFDKKKRHPGDEVTLIESEHLEAFTKQTGLSIPPGNPRRNIVTRGVRLNELVGKRFRVGAALLEGVELCEPCRIFAKETHREALPFFRGKGGLRSRVLEGGTIRVGDGIDTNPSRSQGRILVTGSAGHLGEGLVRTLREAGHEVVSLDILPSPFTDKVASITDREAVRASMKGVNAVLHAASLHKPHLATHPAQAFVDVNVTGTLVLLEEAVAAGASTFVYTSTTSAFGKALQPPPGAPAAWITEEVAPIPKNMYGATKTAAEDICGSFHGKNGMNCLVLRTSRFFPEEDDRKAIRDGYEDANTKANEFLHRRVELEDVVSAHVAALERAADVGFARYIISATTPFTREHLAGLRSDAPGILKRLFPGYEEQYRRRGWRMFPSIDRVYVNEKACRELGWRPRYDFARILACLQDGDDLRSPLARAIGRKGYHETRFEGMPFPVQAE
jgi:UDP-glucose 4-epimerase